MTLQDNSSCVIICRQNVNGFATKSASVYPNINTHIDDELCNVDTIRQPKLATLGSLPPDLVRRSRAQTVSRPPTRAKQFDTNKFKRVKNAKTFLPADFLHFRQTVKIPKRIYWPLDFYKYKEQVNDEVREDFLPGDFVDIFSEKKASIFDPGYKYKVVLCRLSNEEIQVIEKETSSYLLDSFCFFDHLQSEASAKAQPKQKHNVAVILTAKTPKNIFKAKLCDEGILEFDDNKPEFGDYAPLWNGESFGKEYPEVFLPGEFIGCFKQWFSEKKLNTYLPGESSHLFKAWTSEKASRVFLPTQFVPFKLWENGFRSSVAKDRKKKPKRSFFNEEATARDEKKEPKIKKSFFTEVKATTKDLKSTSLTSLPGIFHEWATQSSGPSNRIYRPNEVYLHSDIQKSFEQWVHDAQGESSRLRCFDGMEKWADDNIVFEDVEEDKKTKPATKLKARKTKPVAEAKIEKSKSPVAKDLNKKPKKSFFNVEGITSSEQKKEPKIKKSFFTDVKATSKDLKSTSVKDLPGIFHEWATQSTGQSNKIYRPNGIYLHSDIQKSFEQWVNEAQGEKSRLRCFDGMENDDVVFEEAEDEKKTKSGRLKVKNAKSALKIEKPKPAIVTKKACKEPEIVQKAKATKAKATESKAITKAVETKAVTKPKKAQHMEGMSVMTLEEYISLHKIEEAPQEVTTKAVEIKAVEDSVKPPKEAKIEKAPVEPAKEASVPETSDEAYLPGDFCGFFDDWKAPSDIISLTVTKPQKSSTYMEGMSVVTLDMYQSSSKDEETLWKPTTKDVETKNVATNAAEDVVKPTKKASFTKSSNEVYLPGDFYGFFNAWKSRSSLKKEKLSSRVYLPKDFFFWQDASKNVSSVTFLPSDFWFYKTLIKEESRTFSPNDFFFYKGLLREQTKTYLPDDFYFFKGLLKETTKTYLPKDFFFFRDLLKEDTAETFLPGDFYFFKGLLKEDAETYLPRDFFFYKGLMKEESTKKFLPKDFFFYQDLLNEKRSNAFLPKYFLIYKPHLQQKAYKSFWPSQFYVHKAISKTGPRKNFSFKDLFLYQDILKESVAKIKEFFYQEPKKDEPTTECEPTKKIAKQVFYPKDFFFFQSLTKEASPTFLPGAFYFLHDMYREPVLENSIEHLAEFFDMCTRFESSEEEEVEEEKVEEVYSTAKVHITHTSLGLQPYQFSLVFNMPQANSSLESLESLEDSYMFDRFAFSDSGTDSDLDSLLDKVD